MDGGTDIVHEARQCERRRATPATNGVLRLVHGDVETRASKLDRGSKTIRSGPDNNCVCCSHVSCYILTATQSKKCLTN